MSPQKRSALMSRIRGKNTKPEKAVAMMLRDFADQCADCKPPRSMPSLPSCKTPPLHGHKEVRDCGRIAGQVGCRHGLIKQDQFDAGLRKIPEVSLGPFNAFWNRSRS